MDAGRSGRPERHEVVAGESRCSCGAGFDDPDELDAHVFEARGAALADRMVRRMGAERPAAERIRHSVGALGVRLLVIAALVWLVLRYT